MTQYKVVYADGCLDEEDSILTLVRLNEEPGKPIFERYDRRTNKWISDDLADRMGLLYPDTKKISPDSVGTYLSKFFDLDRKYHDEYGYDQT